MRERLDVDASLHTCPCSGTLLLLFPEVPKLDHFNSQNSSTCPLKGSQLPPVVTPALSEASIAVNKNPHDCQKWVDSSSVSRHTSCITRVKRPPHNQVLYQGSHIQEIFKPVNKICIPILLRM